MKRIVLGFGHLHFKGGDPRSKIVRAYSEKLANTPYGDRKMHDIACHLESRMCNEHKLYANMDFFLTVLLHQLQIPACLLATIHCLSRAAGSSAHIFEQRTLSMLISPIGNYVGPADRPYRQRL